MFLSQKVFQFHKGSLQKLQQQSSQFLVISELFSTNCHIILTDVVQGLLTSLLNLLYFLLNNIVQFWYSRSWLFLKFANPVMCPMYLISFFLWV